MLGKHSILLLEHIQNYNSKAQLYQVRQFLAIGLGAIADRSN
ncbi:hypothetical protein [Sphaerospermopsis sp. FACHB-1194]|nr:hypothetical protein [Sphaerospermopsis sp. FACHB-1194]